MSKHSTKPPGKGGRLLLYVLGSLIGIPLLILFLLIVTISIFLFPYDKNVSSYPQFSEIYLRTFTAQAPIFLDQWPDTKKYYLTDHESSSEFPIIEKGDQLTVKKIVRNVNSFAGDLLHVIVEVDDPKFSSINSRGIDGRRFLLNYYELLYNEGLALFDPGYLRTDQGMTLHRAVQYGDLEAVKKFVELGADPNQKDLDGKSPLHYADKPEIVAYLLDNGAAIDHTDRWGNTLLHYLTFDNTRHGENLNRESIALLIQRGASLELKDSDGNPPLIRAAKGRNFLIADDLLRAGANPNNGGDNGDTILLVAAHYDEMETAVLALRLGADPNFISRRIGMSPLHVAARNENHQMVELLLEAGANVNIENNVNVENDGGRTPLFYAVGNLEIMRYLIARGASVNHTDNQGSTPLSYAKELGENSSVRLLEEFGAEAGHKIMNGMD